MLATMCLLAADDFLEDLTLIVSANGSPAGGLKALPGMASVAIKPADIEDRLSDVIFTARDNTAVYKFHARLLPCSNNDLIARIWVYTVAPSRTNANVECDITGKIRRCSGQGGSPPTITAMVVHVDLDVDSDNDSDPITGQKFPSENDAEDTDEWPTGSDSKKKPGLVLIVNRGFEEGDYPVDAPAGGGSGGSLPDPKEDFLVDGAKEDDQDLSKGSVVVRGRSGDLDFTVPDGIRLYRKVGTGMVRIITGQRVSAQPGDSNKMPLWLEGITTGVCELKVAFYAESGAQAATDMVKITVVDVPLVVDRDRDGSLTDKNLDLTDDQRRMVFWYNNDTDRGDVDETPGVSDYIADDMMDGGIRLRDLEDYNRMRLKIMGVDTYISNKLMSVACRWVESPTHSLKIKAMSTTDLDLTMKYVTDAGTGRRICRASHKIIEVVDTSQVEVPFAELKAGYGGYHSPWLWKIAGDANKAATTVPAEGKGRLGAVLRWGLGSSARPIAYYRHLFLSGADMRRYYEHWTAGDVLTTPSNYPNPTLASTSDHPGPLSGAGRQGLYDPFTQNATNSIKGIDRVAVHIHGYRMQPWERRAFMETAFKRLYWQGYGGRMVLFSWPTEYVPEGIPSQLWTPLNYKRSEFQARRSGAVVLRAVLIDVTSRYGGAGETNVIAHSMGNVVACEALRLSAVPLANTYIAMQSAEASGAFDRASPNSTGIGGLSYAPDIYRHSAPRQPRSLVTAWEWQINGIADEEGRLGSPTAEIDGNVYHHGVAAAITGSRIGVINNQDAATGFPWMVSQFTKPSVGYFRHRPIQVGLGANGRIPYADRYEVSPLAAIAPFNGFPLASPVLPPAASWRILPWSSTSVAPNDAIGRNAILAFISPSRNIAMGRLGIGDVNSFFTNRLNARDGALGGFGGEIRDHSGQYNYTIFRSKNLWKSILGGLQ